VPRKMKTERVDFKPEKFEISGFYYTQPDFKNKNLSRVYVFYNNGVFFGGFYISNGVEEIKKFFLDDKRVKAAKDLPYSWGVFQVNNDSIMFEKWISSDAFGGYPTVEYIGKIIDRERILINTPKVYSTIRTPTEFKVDTLYYYPFEFIPNNTNKFIK
jgi:hypothetical protein